MAVKKGRLEVVRLLLKNWANPHAVTIDNVTSLQMALHNNDIAMAQVLVGAGVNVDQPDQDGRSLLHDAVERDSLEIVKLLVEAGAYVDWPTTSGFTLLRSAVANGSLEMVKLLIEAGAEVDWPDTAGFTPLHRAVQLGDLEMVKLLIQARANLLPNNYGPLIDGTYLTPLRMAELLGPSDIAAVLTAYAQSIKQAQQRKVSSLIPLPGLHTHA